MRIPLFTHARARRRIAPLGLVVVVVAYASLMSVALVGTYDVAGAVVVAHVLAIPAFLFSRWVLATESDPWIARVIVIGLVAKLLSSFVRHTVAFDIYGGQADAARYAQVGSDVADQLRGGGAGTILGELAGGIDVVGTRFIEILTGIIFAFTGPTTMGGFLVFSWIGFLGLFLFYRAFTSALPEANHRRYAVLVFLLPSLLFWPSSVGKEAWMMFALGLSAYGAARLLTHRTFAVPVVGLGLVACTAVRPHIALAVIVALLVAYLGQRRPTPVPQIPLSKLFIAALLLGALGLLISTSEDFFEVDLAGPSGVTTVLEETQQQTAQGGSQFAPVDSQNPLEIPLAAVTVLFRPLFFEAGSPLRLLVSLEGTVLLVMVMRSWRTMVATLRARPSYVVFAAVYSLLFIIAFSSIGNFGILARQRVQLLPFFVILMSVPAAMPAAARTHGEGVRTRVGSSPAPGPAR